MMFLQKIGMDHPTSDSSLTSDFPLNFNLLWKVQPQTSEFPNEFQTGNWYFLKPHSR